MAPQHDSPDRTRQLKSPVFPDTGKIVPKVSSLGFREFARNSLNSSKAVCKSGMSQFESCQVSQLVRQLKIVRNPITKRPLNKGFLALCGVSPHPEKWQPSREIVESLQPICVIFPFSGDFARRLFSICTARSTSQCFPVSGRPVLMKWRHLALARMVAG
jgi:hypothetical protein